jgi:hypothetical protein
MSGASLALESSRNQQPVLESALQGAGIDYLWLPDLGGRRRPFFEYAEHHLAAPGIPGLRRPDGRRSVCAGLLELLTLAWVSGPPSCARRSSGGAAIGE